MIQNMLVKVKTSGGLSSLAESPVYKLKLAIDKANKEGWYVRQIIHDETSNFLLKLLYGLILLLTLFIWCPSRAYVVVFEKDVDSVKDSEISESNISKIPLKDRIEKAQISDDKNLF